MADVTDAGHIIAFVVAVNLGLLVLFVGISLLPVRINHYQSSPKEGSSFTRWVIIALLVFILAALLGVIALLV